MSDLLIFEIIWVSGYLIWISLAYSNIQLQNRWAEYYGNENHIINKKDYYRIIVISIILWPIFLLIQTVVVIKDKFF